MDKRVLSCKFRDSGLAIQFKIMCMSYKTLDIYKESFDLFVEVHPFTLKLPKYELYEMGSQLRRSSNSVVSNIVEGYGRRIYKAEYIRFLIFSHASNDETINHLMLLQKIYPSMSDECECLIAKYNNLGGKINNFIKYVNQNWKV